MVVAPVLYSTYLSVLTLLYHRCYILRWSERQRAPPVELNGCRFIGESVSEPLLSNSTCPLSMYIYMYGTYVLVPGWPGAKVQT